MREIELKKKDRNRRNMERVCERKCAQMEVHERKTGDRKKKEEEEEKKGGGTKVRNERIRLNLAYSICGQTDRQTDRKRLSESNKKTYKVRQPLSQSQQIEKQMVKIQTDDQGKKRGRGSSRLR